MSEDQQRTSEEDSVFTSFLRIMTGTSSTDQPSEGLMLATESLDEKASINTNIGLQQSIPTLQSGVLSDETVQGVDLLQDVGISQDLEDEPTTLQGALVSNDDSAFEAIAAAGGTSDKVLTPQAGIAWNELDREPQNGVSNAGTVPETYNEVQNAGMTLERSTGEVPTLQEQKLGLPEALPFRGSSGIRCEISTGRRSELTTEKAFEIHNRDLQQNDNSQILEAIPQEEVLLVHEPSTSGQDSTLQESTDALQDSTATLKDGISATKEGDSTTENSQESSNNYTNTVLPESLEMPSQTVVAKEGEHSVDRIEKEPKNDGSAIPKSNASQKSAGSRLRSPSAVLKSPVPSPREGPPAKSPFNMSPSNIASLALPGSPSSHLQVVGSAVPKIASPRLIPREGGSPTASPSTAKVAAPMSRGLRSPRPELSSPKRISPKSNPLSSKLSALSPKGTPRQSVPSPKQVCLSPKQMSPKGSMSPKQTDTSSPRLKQVGPKDGESKSGSVADVESNNVSPNKSMSPSPRQLASNPSIGSSRPGDGARLGDIAPTGLDSTHETILPARENSHGTTDQPSGASGSRENPHGLRAHNHRMYPMQSTDAMLTSDAMLSGPEGPQPRKRVTDSDYYAPDEEDLSEDDELSDNKRARSRRHSQSSDEDDSDQSDEDHSGSEHSDAESASDHSDHDSDHSEHSQHNRRRSNHSDRRSRHSDHDSIHDGDDKREIASSDERRRRRDSASSYDDEEDSPVKETEGQSGQVDRQPPAGSKSGSKSPHHTRTARSITSDGRDPLTGYDFANPFGLDCEVHTYMADVDDKGGEIMSLEHMAELLAYGVNYHRWMVDHQRRVFSMAQQNTGQPGQPLPGQQGQPGQGQPGQQPGQHGQPGQGQPGQHGQPGQQGQQPIPGQQQGQMPGQQQMAGQQGQFPGQQGMPGQQQMQPGMNQHQLGMPGQQGDPNRRLSHQGPVGRFSANQKGTLSPSYFPFDKLMNSPPNDPYMRGQTPGQGPQPYPPYAGQNTMKGGQQQQHFRQMEKPQQRDPRADNKQGRGEKGKGARSGSVGGKNNSMSATEDNVQDGRGDARVIAHPAGYMSDGLYDRHQQTPGMGPQQSGAQPGQQAGQAGALGSAQQQGTPHTGPQRGGQQQANQGSGQRRGKGRKGGKGGEDDVPPPPPPPEDGDDAVPPPPPPLDELSPESRRDQLVNDINRMNQNHGQQSMNQQVQPGMSQQDINGQPGVQGQPGMNQPGMHQQMQNSNPRARKSDVMQQQQPQRGPQDPFSMPNPLGPTFPGPMFSNSPMFPMGSSAPFGSPYFPMGGMQGDWTAYGAPPPPASFNRNRRDNQNRGGAYHYNDRTSHNQHQNNDNRRNNDRRNNEPQGDDRRRRRDRYDRRDNHRRDNRDNRERRGDDGRDDRRGDDRRDDRRADDTGPRRPDKEEQRVEKETGDARKDDYKKDDYKKVDKRQEGSVDGKQAAAEDATPTTGADKKQGRRSDKRDRERKDRQKKKDRQWDKDKNKDEATPSRRRISSREVDKTVVPKVIPKFEEDNKRNERKRRNRDYKEEKYKHDKDFYKDREGFIDKDYRKDKDYHRGDPRDYKDYDRGQKDYRDKDYKHKDYDRGYKEYDRGNRDYNKDNKRGDYKDKDYDRGNRDYNKDKDYDRGADYDKTEGRKKDESKKPWKNIHRDERKRSQNERYRKNNEAGETVRRPASEVQ